MARRKLHGIQFDSPDEREVFHAKESWAPLFLGAIPYVLTGICALVICSAFLFQPQVGIIAFAICLVLALITRIPHIIANLDTDVIITNRRLYSRTGIINIKDQVTELSNISDVTVDPSVFGRLFDYAHVRIQTYAGESDFVLKNIAHAYDMRAAISRGVDAGHEASPRPGGPRRDSPRQRRS